MAADAAEDHLDNVETTVLDCCRKHAGYLQTALQEKLTPKCFKNPRRAEACGQLIEHPDNVPTPNGDLEYGRDVFRRLVRKLVAAEPNRPLREERAKQQVEQPYSPPQPPQHAKQRAADPKTRSRKQGKRHSAGERQNGPVAEPKKETPREILWCNQVLLDIEHADKPPMPPSCFRVAYVISQLWNPQTDDAWPAQSTVAKILKLDRSTVSRLTGPLVERGHLQVTAGDGRGHTSHYRPIVKEPVIRRLIAKEKPPKPAV